MMKKLKFALLTIGLIATAASCRMDKRHNGRHVTLAENSNNNHLMIEYSGTASFNKEGTAIASITPGGYVKYKKNGRQLMATSDNNGLITYIVDHGERNATLDTEERLFLAQAVQDMIKHGHYNDAK